MAFDEQGFKEGSGSGPDPVKKVLFQKGACITVHLIMNGCFLWLVIAADWWVWEFLGAWLYATNSTGYYILYKSRFGPQTPNP